MDVAFELSTGSALPCQERFDSWEEEGAGTYMNDSCAGEPRTRAEGAAGLQDVAGELYYGWGDPIEFANCPTISHYDDGACSAFTLGGGCGPYYPLVAVPPETHDVLPNPPYTLALEKY